MAPRSAKRLTGTTKKPARRRKSTPVSFSCYAVVEDMSVSFFAKRADAVQERDRVDADSVHNEVTSINKITVTSSEDLAKVLRDNTL